jgi:hypothetical protein
MCEVNEYNPPDSIAEPANSQNESEYGDGRITMNMMSRPAQIVIKATGVSNLTDILIDRHHTSADR